jgi:hypothetical protein
MSSTQLWKVSITVSLTIFSLTIVLFLQVAQAAQGTMQPAKRIRDGPPKQRPNTKGLYLPLIAPPGTDHFVKL